jgi:hypothetical protein
MLEMSRLSLAEMALANSCGTLYSRLKEVVQPAHTVSTVHTVLSGLLCLSPTFAMAITAAARKVFSDWYEHDMNQEDDISRHYLTGNESG